MAQGQTLLNAMEVLDQELQLQASEADCTRALSALNMAQDMFESLVAQEPDLYGDTTGTLTTTTSTETTPFPTGVLRIDRIQYLDPVSSLPKWNLVPSRRAGGGRRSGWPYTALLSSASGVPHSYWTQGRQLHWTPLPSAAHSLRWHGFLTASDITQYGVFEYPDMVILPLAAVATSLMKTGLGDEAGDAMSIATQTLRPVVKTLANFNRDGGQPLNYTRIHTT